MFTHPLLMKIPPDKLKEMMLSRRRLFEMIAANTMKRKLQNSIQATGDRMAATPQQFGMQIGNQVKKAFMRGAANAMRGLGIQAGRAGLRLGNAAKPLVDEATSMANTGAERLGKTMFGNPARAALSGAGLATAGLAYGDHVAAKATNQNAKQQALSQLRDVNQNVQKFNLNGTGMGAQMPKMPMQMPTQPTNPVPGLNLQGTGQGGIAGSSDPLSMSLQKSSSGGVNPELLSMAKQAFLTGATLGAIGGLATSKPGERALGTGRGALIGGGTELGAVGGAGIGGGLGALSGATLGALLGNPAAGAGLGLLAGTPIGALGGGALGHLGTKAVLDSAGMKKKDKPETKSEKKDEEDNKEPEKKTEKDAAVVLPAAGIGAGLGVLTGPPGHRVESAGRGALKGTGTGVGMLGGFPVGALAALGLSAASPRAGKALFGPSKNQLARYIKFLASKGKLHGELRSKFKRPGYISPEKKLRTINTVVGGGLAGSAAGGAAGYSAADALLGDASWENKQANLFTQMANNPALKKFMLRVAGGQGVKTTGANPGIMRAAKPEFKFPGQGPAVTFPRKPLPPGQVVDLPQSSAGFTLGE